MTTTKAKPAVAAFLPDQAAAAALQAAHARRTAVLDRIAAGSAVEPVELAEADDALRLAELVVEVGERNAAADAENARLARLAELVDALTATGHRRRLEQVVTAYRTAAAGLVALHTAATERQAAVAADLAEVRRLAFDGRQPLPLPPGVTVQADAYSGVSVTANGVHAQSPLYADDPAALVADAAAAATATDPTGIGNRLQTAAGSYAGTRAAALEQLLADTDTDTKETQ